MNDDTKQFIANGIALKFGEMATSLVKTMKFQGDEAAQWMQNAVQDFAKKNNLEGASGDEIYEAIQEAGEHHGMMEDYANAGHVAMPEGQTWDDLEGDEYGEYIDAVEGDIIEAADVVSGTPGAGAGAGGGEDGEDGGDSWETSTLAELYDERLAQIDKSIAAGKERVAQTSDPDEKTHADEALGSALNQRNIVEKQMAQAKESYESHAGGETAQDEPKKKSTRCEKGTRKDPKTGQCKPHQARQAMNDNVKMYIANGIAMRFGQVAANFVKTMKFQPQGADTGVEGGGEWPGGPGGKGPKRDQYEWEVDSMGSVIITDTTTGASAFIQVGDEASELRDELDNAPDEHSQQLIMDGYSTIMDPPEGGAGAEWPNIPEPDPNEPGWKADIPEGVVPKSMDPLPVVDHTKGGEGVDWNSSQITELLDGYVVDAIAAGEDVDGAVILDQLMKDSDIVPPGEDPAEYEGIDLESFDEALTAARGRFDSAVANYEIEHADEIDELEAEIEAKGSTVEEELAKSKAEGGAEGEGEEKKSRSDRCETGTHKDPKTGQCKPI